MVNRGQLAAVSALIAVSAPWRARRTVDNFAQGERDSLSGPRQQAAAGAGQDRFDACYLRAAQAYMLISMPTGTSTIFGVFQLIRVLPSGVGTMLVPASKLGCPRTLRKHGTSVREAIRTICRRTLPSWTSRLHSWTKRVWRPIDADSVDLPMSHHCNFTPQQSLSAVF